MEDDRLTLIAEIVRRCAQRNCNLGKIQLQKMVYFLQESCSDLGYTFVIFHYGPFSFDLAEDIERLNTLRILHIEKDDAGYGYHITPGVHCGVLTDTNKDPIIAHDQSLNVILDSFGTMTASAIELSATIHYVHSVLRDRTESYTLDEVKLAVRELKPQFTTDQIAQAMADLPAPFALT